MKIFNSQRTDCNRVCLKSNRVKDLQCISREPIYAAHGCAWLLSPRDVIYVLQQSKVRLYYSPLESALNVSLIWQQSSFEGLCIVS